MMTLTLCRSVAGFFCLQATEDDRLIDLFHLSGETCSINHEWVVLDVCGEQEDSTDTDSYWRAVDTALVYILAHYPVNVAWEAFCSAYAGTLNKRELAALFREARAEVIHP